MQLSKESLIKKYSTTLRDFIVQAQPVEWNNREEMLLDRWFEWPPDIFALTALLLTATGSYRRAFSPVKKNYWPPEDWPKKASVYGKEWRESIALGLNSGVDLPEKMSFYKDEVRRLADLEVDLLYDCEYKKNYDPDATEDEELRPWKLLATILELHGIADEAMKGVGIAFSPESNFPIIDQDYEPPTEVSEFYMQANFMLALRGSLSRVPKFRGTVLPKTRTPQVGITLRSFSQNLTFHQTEVDVAWRAFPWINSDENIINIMVVPWPFKIDANFFSPLLHPQAPLQLGQDRYFHYEPDCPGGLNPEGVLSAIKEVENEVRRIHLLVFPEMALKRRDLRQLKRHLEANLPPHKIPMIVTGVSARYEDGEEASNKKPERRNKPIESQGSASSSDDVDSERVHYEVTPHAKGFNRVVLSLYYGGQWHDVLQDKHHRWKIDDNQIEQYSLGGVLSGGRKWWEAIQVTRRRLTVLAANSWMTVSPLICEDLARLDPVSEVLRGVGPTLLLALLLDGPQLKHRWSARYASVFADDPGSSVLTVTSIGMSKRSLSPGVNVDDEKKNWGVVGLWKDQLKNWRTLSAENVDAPIQVLTVSAVWISEKTSDNRSDQDNSAVFAYQGSFPCQARLAPGGDSGLQKVSGRVGPIDCRLNEEFIQWYDSLEQWCESRKGKAEDQSDDVWRLSWYEFLRDEIGDDIESAKSVESARGMTSSGAESSSRSHRESKGDDAKRKKIKTLDMVELTLFTYFLSCIAELRVDTAAMSEWFEETLEVDCQVNPSQVSNEGMRLVGGLQEILRYTIESRDLVPHELPSPQLIYATRQVKEVIELAKEEFSGRCDVDLRELPLKPDNLVNYWDCVSEVALSGISQITEVMLEESRLALNTKGEYESRVLEVAKEYKKLEVRRREEKDDSNKKTIEVAFNEYMAGRIQLMSRVAILWSLHSRITARRRFGVLSTKGAEVFERIEGALQDSEYQEAYLAWRWRLKVKSYIGRIKNGELLQNLSA
ncbi:MAG: hypothetical protein AAGD01_02740 [Acidobacteriota bacterium]